MEQIVLIVVQTFQKKAELEYFVPKGRQAHQSPDSDKLHVFDNNSGLNKSDVKVSDCYDSSRNVSEDPVKSSVDKVEIQNLGANQDVCGGKVEPHNCDFVDMYGTQSYNKNSELNNTNDVIKESMCSNQGQSARDLSRQELQLNPDNVVQDFKNENIESNWFTNKISTSSITQKSDTKAENKTNEEGKSVEENVFHHLDMDQALYDKSEHLSNDNTEPNAACDKLDLRELCKDDINNVVREEDGQIGTKCLDVPVETVQCDIQTTQPQDSNLEIASNSETVPVLDNSAKDMGATDDIVIHDCKDIYQAEIVHALSDNSQSFDTETSESEKLNNYVSNDINATSNLEESSKTMQESVNKSEVVGSENTTETDDDRCEMNVDNGNDSDKIDNVEQLIGEPASKNSTLLDYHQEEMDELSQSMDTEISW